MSYYAIHRSKPNDELKHWKYIKKKKVNGKWRYYYDESELDKFDKGAVEVKEGVKKDGTKYTNTTEYKKSNKLLSKKEKTIITTNGSIGDRKYKNKSTDITKTQGKLDRAVAKGEKWVFKTFFKKSAKQQTKEKKNQAKKKAAYKKKAMKTIDDFFSKGR